ncbi:MAG: LCP family protein [Actinomycetota bacterium]
MSQNGDTKTDGARPSGSATRSGRASDRRKKRGALTVAIIVVVSIMGAVAVLLAGRAVIRAGGGGDDGGPQGKPAELTMFAVEGDPSYVAIVGTSKDRDPTVLPMPPNLLTALPDVGSGTLEEAVDTSGSLGRMAAANALGAWIPHFATIDQLGLSDMVEARGGLVVNIPQVTLEGETYGPGPTKLRGEQVLEYLHVRSSSEQVRRWSEVLTALFKDRVVLQQDMIVSSDEPGAVARALADAQGADVYQFPSSIVEGGLQQADPAAIQRVIGEVFGIVRSIPVRVIVLNGFKHRAVAELATNELVPAGYQVIAYEDARRLHHQNTEIYVSLKESVPDALRVQEALGVGKVLMTQTSSGLADITIVVGKDFLRR